MSKVHNIAIVGATGVVGECILDIMSNMQIKVNELYLLASESSAGSSMYFNGKKYNVESLNEFDFSKVDLAFFSAGSSVSAEYVPKAQSAGCRVIDNTPAFRMNNNVPLIVPEVNGDRIAEYTNTSIIANPNCVVIQLVMALKPIYDAVGIETIFLATYQSVSGSGKSAISELAKQSGELLNGRPVAPEVYPKQIAFNVIPQIDIAEKSGFTKEEEKIISETKKILGDSSLEISVTAVRVPVFFGHSIAVRLETREAITPDKARAILAESPGIKLLDDINKNVYPTAATEAVNTDSVYVGRIRNDISNANGLNMWIVADNIRKGAALNSLQIATMLDHNNISL